MPETLEHSKLPNIFMIDDQVYNLKIIQYHLSGKYNVDYFSCAKTLLSILESNKTLYCAGIIDYMMPMIDSKKLIHKIRELDTEKSIKIVLTSAYFSDTDEFGILRELNTPLKNIYFLAKPIRKEKLFSIFQIRNEGT